MHSVAKLVVVCGLGLLWLSGCGGAADAPQLAEARGIVTLDGQPLSAANVVFTPEEGGPIALGTTDEQGRFELQTRGQPGAPIGQHTVTVTALEPTGAGDSAEADDSGAAAAGPKSRIPTDYGNRKTSGLTATVTEDPSSNEFTFNLDNSTAQSRR